MLRLQRLAEIGFDLFSVRTLSDPDLELCRSLIGKHLQAIDCLATLFFSLLKQLCSKWPINNIHHDHSFSQESLREGAFGLMRGHPYGGGVDQYVRISRTRSISERADKE